MSAPDQAFTKAYGKDATAAAPAATRQTIVRMRAASSAPGANSGAPSVQLDHLYADGALYRLEVPQTTDVPPPHYTPPASQHRTVQRRVSGRYRGATAVPAETPPTAVEPQVPARRVPALGLNEIARRLMHCIPPAPTADLPPEVIVVAEPASPQPLLNETPPVASAPQKAAPQAEKKPTEILPAPKVESLPSPIVSQPPLEDVATLVEVCTPWESVNDAVSGAMVILTDPPSLSPATQALIEVALDPIIQRGRAAAQEAHPQLAELPAVAEPSAAGPQSDETSAEKKYRLDPPQPQAVLPPHIATVRDVGNETLPALPLATLTTEETESLLGNPPAGEVTDEPASAVLATSAASEPLVPMWEVDRFQWPSICDRLMKDEQSYFAQAGGKLVAAAKDGLKTLGITGSRRGEGRTTLALCLARCAAQSGLNVALIDADFTRPQLAAVIGLEVAYGWQDAAQGKIPLPEAAVRSLADKITVLPLEPSSVAWPLALADKRVASMIRNVAESHDLVIVDLGPMSGGSEPLFAVDETPPLDAVIVLRDLRYATPSETQAIGQRLHDSGIEAVGIAENFVPAEKARA